MDVLTNADLHPTNLLDAQRVIAQLVKENARLRDLAFTDELTKLMKREPVIDRISRELGVHSLNKRKPKNGIESIAVVAVDLIGFKNVNDRVSHTAGDAVLVQTATALTSAVRVNDLVARWGGDEFMLVLWNIIPEDVTIVLDRARSSIKALGHDLDVRMGCVVWERKHGYPANAQRLIDVADANERELHRAKLAGHLVTTFGER